MAYMFSHSTIFNQDISNWDVSNVTNMESMFEYAVSFNQDLSPWDVSNVELMPRMFLITPLNQDLSNWNVNKVILCNDFVQDTHTDYYTSFTYPNFTNCNPN